MYRVRHYVGPPWPPTLEAYDYTRTLTRRDWAWEGLRRDPVYQDDALEHHSIGERSASHADVRAIASC